MSPFSIPRRKSNERLEHRKLSTGYTTAHTTAYTTARG